jgi:hypothetical protein
MLAKIVTLAGLAGYASAACRAYVSAGFFGVSSVPVDVCIVTDMADDGTYEAMQYVCSSDGTTATMTTYATMDCSDTGTEGTSMPCEGEYAASGYGCDCSMDVCASSSIATYVTYDVCADEGAFSNGGAVVVNQCFASALIGGSFKNTCMDMGYAPYTDTTLYTDDSCSTTTTTTTYAPFPTMAPVPTTAPVPSPTPTMCTKFTSTCENYDAAPRVFAPLALLVAALAFFAQ